MFCKLAPNPDPENGQ